MAPAAESPLPPGTPPDRNARWRKGFLIALVTIALAPPAWFAGKYLGAVIAIDLKWSASIRRSIGAQLIPAAVVVAVAAGLVWRGGKRGWFDLGAPAPVAIGGARWRKILWVVVAAMVTAPLVWFAGFILLSSVHLLWERDNLVVASVEAVAAAIGVAWLGLRRGWHGRTGLSIAAIALLALATFIVVVGQVVNHSSQDKAVLGNAHQLSAATDQYFLENGVSTVDYAHLVGATNYVKAINTVAGETYPAFYTQGITITVTNIAGARTITYAP